LYVLFCSLCVVFSSRRRHTRSKRDWSSDVCSSDLSLILSFNPVTFVFIFSNVLIVSFWLSLNILLLSSSLVTNNLKSLCRLTCLLSTSFILWCIFPLFLSHSCLNTYLSSSVIQFRTAKERYN